jgi:hypothetical protein
MRNKKISFLISLTVLFVPFFVLAADSPRPGTDDYLIDNGLTEIQLTTKTATEKREPFIDLKGETTTTDPVGDVVSRYGTHPQTNYGWGDLTNASLAKNNDKQCWQFDFTVAEEIPASPVSLQSNLLVYLDSDNNLENNATTGVRINTDYEVSIKYDQKNGWITGLRWYNKEAEFWAINKTTASTFEFNKNNVSVCIPFTEVSAEVTPIWRAALAISDGSNTQIDVVPGTGFPPPTGETYSTWQSMNNSTPASTTVNNLVNWNAVIIVTGVIGLIVLIKIVFWIIEKKKKQ